MNASPIGGVSYADSNVQSGQTYYYVATSVDASGNESVYSNEVSAIVP
jgi:fibronectin type 3 domain-containing protein